MFFSRRVHAPTMTTIDEKRVYGDRAGKTRLYVATSVGAVLVDVSGGRIGGFGVAHRCSARDVAAANGRVAVATDEDVLFRDPTEDDTDADGTYEPTGFGPAVAVGVDADGWLAAGEDAGVARYDPAAGAWTGIGRAGERDDGDGGGDEEVRAIHGSLVAASDGVYRVAGTDGLDHAGLDDARDVADGVPLAATADGLYSLGNGWMRDRDGSFRAVVADPAGERAHAAAVDGVYARDADAEWTRVDLPTDELVVDFAYGEGATFALTEAGTLLVQADRLGEETDATDDADEVGTGARGGAGDGDAGGDGEWRPQTLGLDGAVSVTAE